MLNLWQFENFAIGNFLVSRIGRRTNGWIVTKRYRRMRMRERELHTKFQLDRKKIFHEIERAHFLHFGSPTPLAAEDEDAVGGTFPS